jgi:putative transposase
VLRYIERNPLRAHLVAAAQDRPWSSAAPAADERGPRPALDPGPVPRLNDWLVHVNAPHTEAEVERLRVSLRRGRPFGSAGWMVQAARRLGLETSLRPRGRPRKSAPDLGAVDADYAVGE